MIKEDCLYIYTNRRLWHERVKHFVNLAYVDNRMLYIIWLLMVLSISLEYLRMIDLKKQVDSNSQHRNQNRRYRSCLKPLLKLHDYLLRLLPIYLNVLRYRNLFS